MSNNILKPIINWLLALIFKADSLSELYSFLKRVYKDVLDEAGDVIGQELDLAQSIYIDWGAFINAVLNFFLIAFVLFTIVKVVNKFRENQKELSKKIAEKTLNRKERRELRSAGVKIHDRAAVEAYFAEKKRIVDEAAAEEAARAAKEAEEKAKADREANPTTEDLLKQILETLKNK